MKDGVGRFSGNYVIYNAGGGTLSVEMRGRFLQIGQFGRVPVVFNCF